MRSKIYSSNFIRTSSRGQMWIPGFLALGFLIAFPVFELLRLGNWMAVTYEAKVLEQLYEDLWRRGLMATGCVIVLGAGIVNGVNSFWYLYSSKKVDFYHSLPITRKKMFLYKTLMGILFYLIPYVVFEFMAVCVGALRGFFSLSLMGAALWMLLIHFVMYLFSYFCTVAAIGITGNILMGALALGGIFLYAPALSTLLRWSAATFFDTGYLFHYGIFQWLQYFSPYTLPIFIVSKGAQGNYWGLCVILLLLTVLAGGAAYLLYIRRNSESAGRPIIYRRLGILLKFMVTVPMALGISELFLMTFVERKLALPWWIGSLIVSTVVIHGMIEVMLRMDFRGFFRARLHLLIALVLVGVCGAAYQFDLLGFDTYVPARDKLAAVNFDLGIYGTGGEYTNYIKKTGDKYKTYEWDEDEAAVVKGEDGFDKGLYDTLADIVKKSGDKDHEKSEDVTKSLGVRYVLDSGRMVYRAYELTPGDIRRLWESIYEEGTYLEKKYSFLDLEDKYLTYVSAAFQDDENYSLFQNDPKEYSRLLNALREDVSEASPKELLEIPCAVLRMQYENIPSEENFEYNFKGYGVAYYTNFYVFPSFERTVAVLKETGYPIAMEEVEISKVSAEFYGPESADGSTLLTATEEYTDDHEFREIKESLIPSSFLVPWVEFQEGLEVYFDVNDRGHSSYGRFLKDKVPDFIEEKLEKIQSGEYDWGAETEGWPEEMVQETF